METERKERDQVLATTTLEKNQGAKTSDHYRTQNLPHRFENPGKFLLIPFRLLAIKNMVIHCQTTCGLFSLTISMLIIDSILG